MFPDTGETLDYEVQCPECGKTAVITLNRHAYRRWKAGESYIQDLFPELTADQREQLLTGTCGKCWDAMWKEE